MRRLLLIANPSARGFTGAALREVNAALSQHFAVEQVWPEGPEASRLEASKAAAASFDVVAAMGGDGVVHHVANGLVGTETALAVIPAGTTNVLSRLLGVPQKARKAAGAMHRWHPQLLRTVQVTADDSEPFHATFAVGLGYDAAVLARAEKRPHGKVTWGPLHYARSALGELGGHALPTIRASAHSRHADGAAMSIQVQDSYTYLGRLAFRFGGDNSTGFNALVVSKVGAKTVGTLASMASGRLDTGKSDTTVWTDVAALEATADPPTPLQADGEPHGVVSNLKVQTCTDQLLVLRP